MYPRAATKESKLGNGLVRYPETTTSKTTIERMTFRGNGTKTG